MVTQLNRRNTIKLAAVLATGALTKSEKALAVAPYFGEVKTRECLSPIEDLTRQHGVLRRIVNVYAETERRIRSGQTDIDAAAIVDAAALFRAFGQEWHERLLEEGYVFPAARKAGGQIEKLVDILLCQHRRGREITDYLISAAAWSGVPSEAGRLAEGLGSMARMYNAHAAFEDTVIFPAWRAMLSKDELDEMAGLFQDMEHQAFGKDGFENAVSRVKKIEQALGVPELDVFTAPHPPTV